MKRMGMTKADKWLIGTLLFLSISGIVLNFILFPDQANTSAEIRIDGTLVRTVSLRKGYNEEFRIGGQTEYAVIEANDGRIRIHQDDSPRQIGVQTGWISKAPQQVVNLPYRIVITLVSTKSIDIDDIAR